MASWADALHSCAELTLVRIRVTRGAREIGKAIGNALRFNRRLMTICAGHGYVPTRQDEAALLVLGECKCGRVECRLGVAPLTFVEIGRRGELCSVCILMAINAKRKLHLEKRCFSGGQMALGTINRGMFSTKRETGI